MPIFYPQQYYSILTHGITKGWLCIDGILSIWLNQQHQPQIMKDKAEEKVGAIYSSILSPLLLLYPLQTARKYLMGALIQNRCRRRRWGRAGRFVSNRFGQNVSPISRFASVWLPLAKLGEQRNSMNMLSPGIGGMGVWVWATRPEQPPSCNIYAPEHFVLKSDKWNSPEYFVLKSEKWKCSKNI